MHTHTHTHTLTCTHTGILYNLKKKEILPFATTWNNLEGIMLSEIARQRKTKGIAYVRNLRNRVA